MSRSSAGCRRSLVAGAAAVLSVAALVAAPAGVATSDSGHAGATQERWAGYRIKATGDADGGWIGGYRVGSTSLYLTTPTRKPNRAGYRDPREVDDLAGRAGSARETERAAWILSKYGGYRDATQAAAVDATVYHLLVGGRWRIDAARGARRIRQSGDPASVARFARIMLRQSRASAGAYTAELVTSGADVGGTMAVTLTVLDGHGRPAAGLPVTLTMTGAPPLASVTGDDGRAVARFSADTRGWQDVTATVRNVPDHLLHVWPPEKRGQAAAAEGGTRRTLAVSTRSPVRGPQTLALTADASPLLVGDAARVTVTVGGDSDTRTATATLFGPFKTQAQAACTGPSVGTVSSAVSVDGSYALPAMTTTGGGYFAWRVAVDGTATSIPASGCGAIVKVRSKAVTTVLADPQPVSAGEIGATGTLSGLPFPDQVSLTATLAGPYGSPQLAVQDGCNKIADTAIRNLTGNGSIHFTIGTPTAGTYYWQVQASAGDLWVGQRSTCAASGSMVVVP